MTESEWHGCIDSARMLEFLLTSRQASERKLRLFAVACCRGVWDWMTDARSRRGVEVAEQYADGLVGKESLEAARQGTADAWTTVWGDGWHIYQSARAAHWTCGEGKDELLRVADETKNATRNSASSQPSGFTAHVSEMTRQSLILRDLFGPHPFRFITVDDSWLRWNDGCVANLATAIYQNRDWSLMPMLADALEDAGCANPDIIEHCRSAGEHVAGCWVVDLLLSKQ